MSRLVFSVARRILVSGAVVAVLVSPIVWSAPEAPAKPASPGAPASPATPAPAAPSAPAAPVKAPAPPKQAEGLPTGKEVHEKFIEVTGGRAAQEKFKYLVSNATMAVPSMGISAKMTVTQAQPDKIRVLTDMAGMGKTDQGHDGTIAWEVNPSTGARLVEGEELEGMIRQASIGTELDIDRAFTSLVTEGEEAVDGKPAYRVVCTPKTGSVVTRFYDKESSLLVKQAMTVRSQMGEVPSVTLMSDYRDVDGVKMSFKTVTRIMETMELVITMEKIEHPAELPADAFTPPAEVKELLSKPAEKTPAEHTPTEKAPGEKPGEKK